MREKMIEEERNGEEREEAEEKKGPETER